MGVRRSQADLVECGQFEAEATAGGHRCGAGLHARLFDDNLAVTAEYVRHQQGADHPKYHRALAAFVTLRTKL
uniref:Transposase n=1 Tax=Macrostomum lignano TaxID=282301 RepID=A0A1I8FTW7_9PLAT